MVDHVLQYKILHWLYMTDHDIKVCISNGIMKNEKKFIIYSGYDRNNVFMQFMAVSRMFPDLIIHVDRCVFPDPENPLFTVYAFKDKMTYITYAMK
jgi:hypothetical protein